MTAPTTDLLAGLIDLAPHRAPHGPGPCVALCGPTCAGLQVGATAPPAPGEHGGGTAEHDGGHRTGDL